MTFVVLFEILYNNQVNKYVLARKALIFLLFFLLEAFEVFDPHAN